MIIIQLKAFVYFCLVVEVGDDITPCLDQRTLVLVNHQSTADVPLLMTTFNTKQEVLPNIMWIMDKVFMYTNFGIVSVIHKDFFIGSVSYATNAELVHKITLTTLLWIAIGATTSRASSCRASCAHWESIHSKEAWVDGAVSWRWIFKKETWSKSKVRSKSQLNNCLTQRWLLDSLPRTIFRFFIM